MIFQEPFQGLDRSHTWKQTHILLTKLWNLMWILSQCQSSIYLLRGLGTPRHWPGDRPLCCRAGAFLVASGLGTTALVLELWHDSHS